ncbi:bile acid:sodium symporter family protein [Robiginitomaculum antarcticum]|uniref:bile acid:sodium symporter family protein n=1 Tax=Robiginitomaculum antarcticum TaxID=437507 RepID=UPI000364C1A3|nr:bile acid:sodium symporter [Robiginitomaculum antarcticum]
MEAELNAVTLELGKAGDIAMLVALALMMLAVALGLKRENFGDIRRRPKPFFAGAIAQIIGLPMLTLGLVYLINPLPSLALGMIIVACCPGGSTSNLITLFARGNTALSVSLTATSSLLAAVITPVSIIFWSSLYPPTANILNNIDFDAAGFLIQLMTILGLPILVGMIIAAKAPAAAKILQRITVALGAVLLAIIIIGAVAAFWETIVKFGYLIIPLVLVHNGLAFILGNLAGRFAGGDDADRRALTIETGIQNSGIAIVILLTQLKGLGGAAAIAGIWGTWHIIGGLLLVALWRALDRRKAKRNV